MNRPAAWASKAEATIRAAALAYPEATEDHPWGDVAFKVKKKVFCFMGSGDGVTWGLSVKLPESHGAALVLPFAAPTGYGLGKAGWVSASFTKGDSIPLGLLKQWLDESYRAIAPKAMLKVLAGAASAVTSKPPRLKPTKRSRRA